MDAQLLMICALTFVIHVIATLAYAVRIAGIRTRWIAVSFALFGIIALVSRTANSFQGPFLAKRVEEDLAHHIAQGMLAIFACSCWQRRSQPSWAPSSFRVFSVTLAAPSCTSRRTARFRVSPYAMPNPCKIGR
jgi:hypothetical protein